MSPPRIRTIRAIRTVRVVSPSRMIAGLPACLVCLVCLVCPALGCGDDDGGTSANHQASCDRACARAAECTSTVNATSCATDCKADTEAIGPNLSNAFLAGIDACIEELTCPEIAVASVFSTCQRESAARIAPSSAAESLCQAVVASIQECGGVTVGTAGCLDSVKIFGDGALERARACENEPCDQRLPCLQSELGVDPTAG